jgi:hypothetical protein
LVAGQRRNGRDRVLDFRVGASRHRDADMRPPTWNVI